MSIAVWFDGDETLWDRQGYTLSDLLDPEGQASEPTGTSLYNDVLPTFVALNDAGTVNLISYAPMPEGLDELLPPTHQQIAGPKAPSALLPELQATESQLNWIEILDHIEQASGEVDDIVFVSNTTGAFEKASERGWITVWLNRDRVANLSETLATAEIHTLLDLPEVLAAIDEARAAIDEAAAAITDKPSA